MSGMSTAPRRIRVPRHCLMEMIAHAIEGWPEEICGLVGGNDGLPTQTVRITNVDDKRRVRYTMEPGEQLRALMDIERDGALYGIYHSHPLSVAEPSKTDRAIALDEQAPRGEQALWPGAVYFIVSMQHAQRLEVLAWNIDELGNVPLEIEVIEPDLPVDGPATAPSPRTDTIEKTQVDASTQAGTSRV